MPIKPDPVFMHPRASSDPTASDWATWIGAAQRATRAAVRAWIKDAVLQDCDNIGGTAVVKTGCLRRSNLYSMTEPLNMETHISAMMSAVGAPDYVARRFSFGIWSAWKEWAHGVWGHILSETVFETLPGLWSTNTIGPQSCEFTILRVPYHRMAYKALTPAWQSFEPFVGGANLGEIRFTDPSLLTLYLVSFMNVTPPGTQDAIHDFAVTFCDRFTRWRDWVEVCNIVGDGTQNSDGVCIGYNQAYSTAPFQHPIPNFNPLF